MTPSMLDLSEGRKETFVPLIETWLSRRGMEVDRPSIEVLEVEVLLPGRPSLLDLVARVGEKTAHLVFGLHPEGSDIRTLRGVDDGVLGEFEDELGRARVVDALFDGDLAPLLLAALVGEQPGVLSLVREEHDTVVLDAGDRCTFVVFSWLGDRPNPAVEMLASLDEVGFNHLAAPIALWRRRGRDLGLVTEQLTERADGWAVARTSLRDLYGSTLAPEQAGGDFAAEARALGRMTGRMHLASDKAFGRGEGVVADWAAAVDSALAASSSTLTTNPEAARLIELARCDQARYPTVRIHGDLHLGCTARTNQGWVVADWRPGGVDALGAPLMRSPLCDVATMAWSLGAVAMTSLEERDLALRDGFESVASAWVARNRAAFVSGYLATPGITELVPSALAEVESLIALFELEHVAGRDPGAVSS